MFNNVPHNVRASAEVNVLIRCPAQLSNVHVCGALVERLHACIHVR